MAVRTIRIGNYPDYRDEIRGKLAEILALPISQVNKGTFANPEDVEGCTLEMSATGWKGDVGGFASDAEVATLTGGNYGALSVGNAKLMSAGTQKTWQGAAVGWIGPTSAPLFAVGGDSIAAQDGNAGIQALCANNFPVALRNYALGGTRINEQGQFLPQMASDGCRRVLFQVGANDMIQNRTPLQVYSDTIDLINSARTYGIEPAFISITPLGTGGRNVLLNNLAMYRACKLLGVAYYDAWQDSVNAVSGGWYGGASATTGGDIVHPIYSVRSLAATVLAAQMANGGSSSPLIRANSENDGYVTTFAATFQATNELNELYVSGSGVTSTTEAYNANGSKWLVLTAPVSSSGKLYKYQAIPCTAGDIISFSGVMFLASAVDETTGYNDMTRLEVAVMYERSSGGNIEYAIGGRAGSSKRRFYFEHIAPPLATKVYIKIYFQYASSASAQVAKIRNIGMVNLTAAGIP